MKQFDFVRISKPKKSVFDLSQERKFTMNMGDLVPFMVQEVLPGDKFRCNTEMLMRMMPTLAPVMHRVNVFQHFFFVPNRIIWDGWEKFLTGGHDGTTVVNHPKFTGTAQEWYNFFSNKSVPTLGNLGDYLGVPTDKFAVDGNDNVRPNVSQLPFRAYQKIWFDYYRDQTIFPDDLPENMQTTDSNDLNMDTDQDDIINIFQLRKRAWEKDYFTSSLPWTQRGEAVSMPLGTTAPVIADSDDSYLRLKNHFGGAITASTMRLDETGAITNSGDTVGYDYESGLQADLSTATAATVNDLRRAFSLQRWLEKNARGGARLIEHVLMHFGVRSSDQRLQRAEYLGGGKLGIQISEVLQTANYTDSQAEATPLGSMAGHGVAGGNVSGFSKYFEEHGFVIGIVSVLPRTAYQDGLPKIFSKFSNTDYYYEDFANIGEVPVLNQEIFINDVAAANDDPFGYQPRYSEYRYNYDTVHGDMRDSLDYWHLGRKFSGNPSLNEDFIECKAADVTRIFPVEDDSHKLIVQTYTDLQAIRGVSKFGTPI